MEKVTNDLKNETGDIHEEANETAAQLAKRYFDGLNSPSQGVTEDKLQTILGDTGEETVKKAIEFALTAFRSGLEKLPEMPDLVAESGGGVVVDPDYEKKLDAAGLKVGGGSY